MTASGGKPSPVEVPAAEKQRLDKWLWFARVVKTRSLAARLVEAGHVRVNAVRVDNAAKGVRLGDVLTVALDRGGVRVLRGPPAGRPAGALHGSQDPVRGPVRARRDPARRRRGLGVARHADAPASWPAAPAGPCLRALGKGGSTAHLRPKALGPHRRDGGRAGKQ